MERGDVSATAAQADALGPFESGTIRVPLRGEEAVVAKEVVVRGEVVIRKTPVTYRQEIQDTVRRLRVEVEENVDAARAPRIVRREDADRPRVP